MIKDYSFPWKPKESVCVEFDDQTAMERTPEQLSEMIRRFKEIANEFDFDLCSWGNSESMRRMMAGITKAIEESNES